MEWKISPNDYESDSDASEKSWAKIQLQVGPPQLAERNKHPHYRGRDRREDRGVRRLLAALDISKLSLAAIHTRVTRAASYLSGTDSNTAKDPDGYVPGGAAARMPSAPTCQDLLVLDEAWESKGEGFTRNNSYLKLSDGKIVAILPAKMHGYRLLERNSDAGSLLSTAENSRPSTPAPVIEVISHMGGWSHQGRSAHIGYPSNLHVEDDDLKGDIDSHKRDKKADKDNEKE
jgi:hypothetical protein